MVIELYKKKVDDNTFIISIFYLYMIIIYKSLYYIKKLE